MKNKLKTSYALMVIGFYLIPNICYASKTGENLTKEDGIEATSKAIPNTCQNYKHTIIKCLGKECVEGQGTVLFEVPTDQQGEAGVHCAQVTFGNSVIENQSFNHIHYASDWAVNKQTKGCTPCGSGDGSAQASQTIPNLQVKRIHRFRDITEHSSFGPGVFLYYDKKITLGTWGNGNRVSYFDPSLPFPINYDDGATNNAADVADGIYYEHYRWKEKSRWTDKLTLFDAANGSGNITVDQNLAESAVLRMHNGVTYVFEIVDMANGDREGRLIKQLDRNGYGVHITYHNFSQDEINISPEKQFQIASIRDDNNRSINISYASTQVSGQWVIERITLPNGQDVTYHYTAGNLSSINHPDGSESTFSFGQEPGNSTTTLAYDDPSAGGTHRKKTVYLTNNFSEHQFNGFSSVYNSASLLVRMVANGEGELSYMNLFNPNNPYEWIIYEGGNKMRHVFNSQRYRHFADGWTLDPSKGFQGVVGAKESSQLKEIWNNDEDLAKGTPASIIYANGKNVGFTYDSENFTTSETYNDGSTIKYTYNQFKQITRKKDRLGRVTRYIYDSRGNMLSKAVGILDNGNGGNINQPEYAVYRQEYFPEGHPHQFLKSASIDANDNRTDYVYSSDNLLIKIIEPADVSEGTRAEQIITYDQDTKLVESIADAIGRVTSYTYDERDRVIVTTYQDLSTERLFYGIAGSENENLVVMKTDRNGNVTEFDFDSHGRQISKIAGEKVMDELGNITPVPDTSIKDVETCTYVKGTNNKKASCLRNGELTNYTYDYRNRIIVKTVHPKEGISLTSSYLYANNLFAKETDAYGRHKYFNYRSSDKTLVRMTQGMIPNDGIIYASTAPRILSNNAPYLITDYILDAEGQLLTTIDPRGISHTNEYDSRGRVIRKVQASGNLEAAQTELIYDAQSNVVEKRSPRYFDSSDPAFGLTKETMSYTGRNLLSSRTVAAGSADEATETFTYYLDKKIKKHTDFRGNDWNTLWHNCCGRLQAQIDPLGNGTISNNDFYGNVTHTATVRNLPLDVNGYSWHDPVNSDTLNETTFQYDSRNRLVAQTNWLVPLGYVECNDVPIATDPTQGLTTRYEYFDDALTSEPKLTYLLAKMVEDGVSFDDINNSGSAVLVINPEGEVSAQVMDGIGRVVGAGILDANNNYNVITWRSTLHDSIVNELVETSQIDALDHINKSRVDGAGRLQELVDAESHLSTFEYDANSNLVQSRDPNGVGENCTFDLRNRKIECQDTQEQAEQTSRAFAYDDNNNLISTTDAKGKTTTRIYDARDRLSSINDRVGAVTEYTYDGNNNLLTIKDGEEKTTVYEYDPRNLLTKTTYPDHVIGTDVGDSDYGIVECAYDAAGRKSILTDQKGDTTTYEYDLLNRMLFRKYRLEGAGSDESQDEFTYDDAGRIKTAIKGRYGNQIGYAYDNAGRVESEFVTVDHGGANPITYTTQYEYDDASRLTQCTYPDGSIVDKGLTDRNQLSSIDYNGLQVSDFTYDAGMRESNHTLGVTGLTRVKEYNRDDNLMTRSYITGKPELSYNYAYDQNKNVVDDNIEGLITGYSWGSVGYDDENRLISWNNLNTQSRSWALDYVGNFESRTVDGVLEPRTHSDIHETTAVAGANLIYDSKGNLTNDQDGQVFVWDIDNHMSSSTNGSVMTTYEYDAIGRRVSKSTSGSETVYVSSGQQVISEYDGAGAHERSYVYGSYVDKPVVMIDIASGDQTYYHCNRQYSVTGLTDEQGDVVELYAYTPYGIRTVIDAAGNEKVNSSSNNPYGFTGRRLDSETGMWYFRARYYSDELGRFISRDPLGYVDGMSLYRGYFVPNGVDPSGKNFPGFEDGSSGFGPLGWRDYGPDRIVSPWIMGWTNYFLWMAGMLPTSTTIYEHGSTESILAQQSTIGRQLESRFETRNENINCENWVSINNAPLDNLLFPDVFYGQDFFIGGGLGHVHVARYDYDNKKVIVQFAISNTTSLTSFNLVNRLDDEGRERVMENFPNFYDREPGGIFGNWSQIYFWEKEYDCACPPPLEYFVERDLNRYISQRNFTPTHRPLRY